MALILSFLMLVGLATKAMANDELVILSPHRKTIQAEFVPVFKDYYKKKFATEVDVESLAWIGKPLVSEQEMLVLADKWDDEVFRNSKINEWSAAARKKYAEVVAGRSPWAAH